MKNKNLIIIFFLFVLAIFLRSINLNKGYSGDEVITLLSASENFSHIIPTLIKYDAHPPLTSILLHFWMGISHNEIFIRYYFILFGMGVLLVTYFIAREYFGKNRIILLLVLFLSAISPMLIFASQYIRNYIDSAFWILLSNYFLLLIVNNKGRKGAWAGYLVSAILSIYTFYFCAFIILSQTIYMFIFKFKERNIIKKWIVSQAVIALLFLPWTPNLLKQIFNKNSALSLHWERLGFKFAGLDLGIYARNISSLFGFDYFFIVYPEGIKRHFGFPLLFLIAVSTFLLLIFFLFLTLKWLRKEFGNTPEKIWFLPCLSLLPVAISWISAKILKILPYAMYLAALHSIFIILISYFFYSLISRYKKTGTVILVSLILLYTSRIFIVITPMYEWKKALEYLKLELKDGDCLVMVDSLPGRETLSIPYFNLSGYIFETDPLTSEYRPLPETSTKNIKDALRPFKRIWFFSCYGNTEIFGGNKIIYGFLKGSDRKEVAVKEFNNVKLTLME